LLRVGTFITNKEGKIIVPHISRKKLQRDVSQRIHDQFIKMLADKKTGRCDNAFGDLLTDTEQLMLAKRFAAIVMLAEGISTYRVRVILKISPTTASYLKDGLDQGLYGHIALLAEQRKEREQFWNEMEVLLRLGMPEMGRNRWKWLDELSRD